MTSSPPPTENFHVTPIVTWNAYQFRPMDEPALEGPTEQGEPEVAK
jgi:hypothetical protein